MRGAHRPAFPLLALVVALTSVAAGCGPAPPLRVTVYAVASPDQPAALDAARRWLGSNDQPPAVDPPLTEIAIFVENAADAPSIVSESHAHPTIGLRDGQIYPATLLTAAPPGLVLPPGMGIRAIVRAALSPGAEPTWIAFHWPAFPSVVSLLAQPPAHDPHATPRPTTPLQQPGESFEPGVPGVAVSVVAITWPDVLIEVDNDSAGRFELFADHMLHATVVAADGTVEPVAPADVAPLTVAVPSHRAARYRYRAMGERPAGAAYLVVTLYHDLKWESDIQGIAVYELPPEAGDS